jgi:RNA polymerase sigma factor (sigma-70 family)
LPDFLQKHSARLQKRLTETFTKWISDPARFSSPEKLLDGLRNADTAAIEHLMGKAEGIVRRMVRTAGQAQPLATDLLHDALVIFIEKLRAGRYQLGEAAPQTYLIGICRRLLANHLRLKRLPITDPIDGTFDAPGDDLRDILAQKERLETLEKLLEKLGPPGNDLIRLKYLEGYSDEEQLQQKLTPFATADSLRTSRSKYLKKLALLAQAWKQKNDAT